VAAALAVEPEVLPVAAPAVVAAAVLAAGAALEAANRLE